MRAAVEARPESAEALVRLLGKLFGEAGRLAEAAVHYERAAELSPDEASGTVRHRDPQEVYRR